MYAWRIGLFLAVWPCCWHVLLPVRAQITDPSEVDALRAIKNKLVDTERRLRNWGRGDPCTSNWTGLSCSNRTLDDGYLHVQELQLMNMNLSGTLAPELGSLSYMKILDFMWNKITGNIPKEVGNVKSLELLLLNGNQLTGVLPDELGYLPNLDRIQIDQNHISGSLPQSFAFLNKTKHFHMNNNSISGQIPPEFSNLPNLVHLLLDNNNLSGYLPPELSKLPKILIIQLDNNRFNGSAIPPSYANMSTLLKLSLRNCSLMGPIPDLSRIPELGYIDLSYNRLTGFLPSKRISPNITTIDFSNNRLVGPIPASFSGLPLLQRLSLNHNSLNGTIPSNLWQNNLTSRDRKLILDFEDNLLSSISAALIPPENVSIILQGNPVCNRANEFNIVQFCGSQDEGTIAGSNESQSSCLAQSCPINYEYVSGVPIPCLCAAPIRVGYRLKSPGFSDFRPYREMFRMYLTKSLHMDSYQLKIDGFIWDEGPRLRMYLKFFPHFDNNSLSSSQMFNDSEIMRIGWLFKSWKISENGIFGPYELLNFTLLLPYSVELPEVSASKLSTAAVAAIVIGCILGSIIVSAAVCSLFSRKLVRNHRTVSRKHLLSKVSIKVDGVKEFSFEEMARATNSFSSFMQVGQGGYGKVYKGILADGLIVAIKRAQGGSLQGEKEFYTEIELLSRLHHRNLVSLLGYCNEDGEQMLVYEFMSNGTLRDNLSAKCVEPLSFSMRLRIALGAARGIFYLHTEANPPIIHRDIKASNILLDSKLNAKVADFGLSRLAPFADAEGAAPVHVSTVVKGTPGYVDPAYFLTHQLTDRSDVYSLGVVFLELLTAMHPVAHGKNIVREVNISYQSGKLLSIMDNRMGSYPLDCVEKFADLALKCCKDETDQRPSMSGVVRELENIRVMVEESGADLSNLEAPVSLNVSNQFSSNSTTSNPFEHLNVSRTELITSVVPTIRPR